MYRVYGVYGAYSQMKERGNIWAIILYVDVNGVWSISSILLDEGERQHVINDTVCECKEFIEYIVSQGREATHGQ